MLPRTYMHSFCGCNSEKRLKEKYLLDLAQKPEKFLWGSINNMGTVKNWEHKERKILTAKEKNPTKMQDFKYLFLYVVVIGGKLFSNHPVLETTFINRKKNFCQL